MNRFHSNPPGRRKGDLTPLSDVGSKGIGKPRRSKFFLQQESFGLRVRINFSRKLCLNRLSFNGIVFKASEVYQFYVFK